MDVHHDRNVHRAGREHHVAFGGERWLDPADSLLLRQALEHAQHLGLHIYRQHLAFGCHPAGHAPCGARTNIVHHHAGLKVQSVDQDVGALLFFALLALEPGRALGSP